MNNQEQFLYAKIIADSYNSEFDSRVTTFELNYPRLIHSELMTHRLFSRNAASSRAIPIANVINMVRENPAMPVHWGKNQAGMQATYSVSNEDAAKALWINAAETAASHAVVMKDMELHKQVVNRILEPYQWMKVVVTSTCYNNWFWLRWHKDADPTIYALADAMLLAYNASTPVNLYEGDWHLPYADDTSIALEDRIKISASCCAQTSYRKTDDSLEKALMVYNRLIESEPVHASPVEHQCTPIMCQNNPLDYFSIPGVTSIDKNMVPWSGNFHGWIQHRQLITGNAKVY